jgi:hypothetical protein
MCHVCVTSTSNDPPLLTRALDDVITDEALRSGDAE